MKKRILIVYHSDDESFKELLNTHISVLIQAADYTFDIDYWNESDVYRYPNWQDEFESLLDRISAIILLVSNKSLDTFLKDEKIRKHLKRKQEGGFPFFIVLAKNCNWKKFSWMKNLQVFPVTGRFLADLPEPDQDEALKKLTEVIPSSIGLESEISEGFLSYFELRNVGHIKQLFFEPNRRLNIITGDNSFGKTMLLECIWWTLTGEWAESPVYPSTPIKTISNISNKNEASISFKLSVKSNHQDELIDNKLNTISFDWQKRQWPETNKGSFESSLIIYAHIDGSFGIWDPVKGKIPPPLGYKRPESPIIFKNKGDIFEGISEEGEKENKRYLCEGLTSQWIKWQITPGSPFYLLEKVIETLSPSSEELLKPANPVTVPGDTREMPAIKFPYGAVPIIHTASSVQRIISLAYLMVWMWQEHQKACSQAQKTPFKNFIFIIDEAECHLHPEWQRTIVPSLLAIQKCLSSELNIQFFITTHSPLLLASLEPEFDDTQDSLFHLDLVENEIKLNSQDFYKHGRVDNWFTSETFGLNQARSKKAEEAINEARNLQLKENGDINNEEVKRVNAKLIKYLSEFDSFWPRWTYFAEQHGVTNDSCE